MCCNPVSNCLQLELGMSLATNPFLLPQFTYHEVAASKQYELVPVVS